MSRFAEGTDPEYIKKVNEELYRTTMIPHIELENRPIGQPLPPSTQSAGYMGIPQIGWIAIIGVGVYYAYTKGMFKK